MLASTSGRALLAGALAALLLGAAALTPGGTAAQESSTYTVTVENLTTGQPLTPPVVVAHTADIDIFEVGEMASESVRLIAENGDASMLNSELEGNADVYDMAMGSGPLMPGASQSFMIDAPAGASLTIITMLICTNDGFTGVDAVALPMSGTQSTDVMAYDAGTEENTEASADLVDPCGAAGPVELPEDGNARTATEDVIMMHPGIMGDADLTDAHAWTGAVARITIMAPEEPTPTATATMPAPTATATPTMEAPGAPDTGTGLSSGDGGSGVSTVLFAAAALLGAGGASVLVARRVHRS